MNFIKKALPLLTFFISVILSPSNYAMGKDFISCIDNPSIYNDRSKELASMHFEDQSDREGPIDKVDWSKVAPRDLKRRVRVGEIFGEGCFKDAADYANAAMIYQHGQTADHAYQTFIWAKRAYDLGDKKSKWLMAAAIDRYLVRINQKQLFATQAGKNTGSKCWCLEPIETSFPESMQLEYTKKTIQSQLQWIKSLNSNEPTCSDTQFCNHPLKLSPKGTVVGLW